MENQCPICHDDNRCRINNNRDCWCTKFSFPKVDKDKLNLPNVCICSNCAKKLGATEKLST